MVDEEKNVFEEEANSKKDFDFTGEKEEGQNVEIMEAPDFDPEKLNKEAPVEKGEKKKLVEEAYGKKVFTIKKIVPTRPKLKNAEGSPIAPEKTKKLASFYKVKLKILFEEDNLCEYYPSMRYWVNDGKLSELPSFTKIDVDKIEEKNDDHFTSEIAKIFAKFARHIGKESNEVSDYDFFTGMIGKKVTLKLTKGEYEGNNWSRNDIVDFVK